MHSATDVLFAVFLLAANTECITGIFCPNVGDVGWKYVVLLPHKDCDKFFECVDGEPVEMSCTKGLYYHIVDQVCEWKDLVDCGGRNIPKEKVPEVTTGDNEEVQTEKPVLNVVDLLPNGCPINPSLHWLLPHEKDCKLFYYCSSGLKELKRCPFGLFFNRKFQTCDWPWNITCRKTTENH